MNDEKDSGFVSSTQMVKDGEFEGRHGNYDLYKFIKLHFTHFKGNKFM